MDNSVIEKVRKLFALAQSSNEHEAPAKLMSSTLAAPALTDKHYSRPRQG